MVTVHPDQARLDFAAAATRGRTRKTDPKSCHDGADQMSGDRLRAQQALVLEAVVACGEDGANAHEVQDWLRNHGRTAPERNGIGSRFAELRDLGWVTLLVDVEHEKCGQVHAATDDGRARLATYLATVAAS